MDTERFQRLERLFLEASELPPEARAALLQRVGADDPRLRVELEALLASDEASAGFLDSPVEKGLLAAVAGKEAAAGVRIGPYRVLGELGRGGMGTVVLAERADGEYEASVAIKLVQSGIPGDELSRRFRAERQILARLVHPHIARLLDGGTTERGVPYVVMEYVEGHPIDAYADQLRLGLRERVQLFLGVCAAVQHAHEQGVVHRDLKPANILVDASGAPKLLDFGIAKVLDDAEGGDVTRTVARRLTPEYASPEQVRGESVGPATDVYGLGAVLYRLLTGAAPRAGVGTSLLELERAWESGPPPSPSQRAATRAPADVPTGDPERWRRALTGDLDNIALMALRTEPERRYPSAAALADDLERWLQGRPVLARGDAPLYRVGKFLRRHRAQVAVAGIAASAAALLVTLREPVATEPVSPPPLDDDRVAVEVFANRTGDPALDPLGAMAMDWTVEGLAQTGLVEVVPGTVALAQQADSSPDGEPSALRLARWNGAATVVTGAIDAVGDSLVARATILDARSGTLLLSVTPVRAPVDDARALLQPLRQRVAGALASVLEPLLNDHVRLLDDPPGYAPYAEFIAGVEAYMRLDDTLALTHLQRAMALDSTYTAAQLTAVLPLVNLGRFVEADSLAEHVEDTAGPDLAPFERMALDFLLAFLDGNRAEAAIHSARGAELAPTSILAYQAARDALDLGRPAEAITRLTAIAPDRGFMAGWLPYWSVLTQAYHMVGDHRGELAAARRGRAQHPASLRILVSEIEAQAARGRLLALRSLLTEARGLDPQLGWTAERAGLVAVRELRAHGHTRDLALALREVRRALAEAPAPSSADEALGLALAHYEAEEWASAGRILRTAPVDTTQLGRLRHDALSALVDVRLGVSDGRAAAARLEADRAPYRMGEPRFWAARLHAVAGRPEEALAALTAAFGEGFPRSIELHREQDLTRLAEVPGWEGLLRPGGG
ncbi:MAG: protein kinase [Gemmatimonadota bacterium]